MKLFFSYCAVVFRVFETLTRSSTTSLIHGLSHISIFLFNRAGLNGYTQFQAEYNKLVYYYKTNQSVDSLAIYNIDSKILLPPGVTLSYVAIPSSQLIHSLTLEIHYQRLLLFLLSRTKHRHYLTSSLCTAQAKLDLARSASAPSEDSPSPSYLYDITTVTNHSNQELQISFKNTLLIASKFISPQLLPLSSPKNHNLTSSSSHRYRTLCFYLDNVSLAGIKAILDDSQFLPFLSSIYSSPHTFTPSFNPSISNWTYPSAISMFSGLSFEQHKHFHRKTRPALSLNDTIYTSPSISTIQSILTSNYSSTYLCGTNWRNKPEHGSHSLFDHCSANPLSDDIYGVLAQSIKHLDLAAASPSYHWIYIMDSHHPIRAPLHSPYPFPPSSILGGLQYETGPKSSPRNYKSSSQVYISQLAAIDSKIRHIVEYSRAMAPELKHRIVLLSDHGTDFLTTENPYHRVIEKHQPLLCLYDDDLAVAQYLNSSSPIIHPTHYIPFTADPFSATSNNLNDHNYSQILYPGKPYQYFYFCNKIAYIYSTNKTMPSTAWASHADMFYFSKIVHDGSWTMSSPAFTEPINEDQVPPFVASHFTSTIRKWLST